MKSQNYVTVLAILNAMATRIANSLPQIEAATRGLQHDFGGGAAAGGLIGAAVGHRGAGAAIGGGLGLGAGALVGDQLQGHENTNYRQQQQINRNQAEIERNRQDVQRLQRQQSEY